MSREWPILPLERHGENASSILVERISIFNDLVRAYAEWRDILVILLVDVSGIGCVETCYTCAE